ncbi:MAG: hypothetical protein K0R17_92 [Rariglobus sp.]|jgi:hypothetical protein|nr:hypothetical protein [Rariglobus sp.]
MNSLSKEEKWLIEREFIAKEAQKEKTRKFRQRVAIVGIVAGVAAASLSILVGGFFMPLIPKIIWVICITTYLGADSLLPSLSKDINFYAHMNPWKQSLESLSDPRDLPFAISLLGCYHLIRVLLSLVLF